MRSVEPEIFLVARPKVDYDAMAAYLREVGGERWLERLDRDQLGNDAQDLAEFAGKICYRSWEPGLNPNVRKVRDDQAEYLQNILKQAHGSVLEHASFTFVLHNVSRVCCYDDDSEVLTTEGWKPWPKVDGTEVFGTLNPVSNELEYQKATEVFHADYSGPMYRVRSEQIDLLVTPNHRMWVQRHDTRAARRHEESFKIETPRDILHKRVKYQKCATWTGRSPDLVAIPGTYRTFQRSDRVKPSTRSYPGVSFPIAPFARFLGYYLAEGSINGHQIVLAQNRGRILDKMADTVRAMGLPAYLPTTGHGCVRTQCVPLRDILAGLGHSHDKQIPAMVGDWAPEIIRIFLEAMIEGDGTTHRTFNHRVIYTSSREMADDLQVLAIKAGWSANIRIDDRTGLERVMPNGQRFRNLRPCYVVSLISRRLTPLVNHGGNMPSRYRNEEGYNDGIEHYAGRVHCVQVPNGLLFVRRNGKPVVSGNTHEIVRHRPGTAISQESLRYVRLDELPFWFPDWAREDAELMKRATALLAELEGFQQWMAGHFGLDDDATKMHEKKLKTSFMRRFAPEGVATGLVWTANIRTLRHTIEARTDQGAEEEIRLVFGKIGAIMLAEAPALFGDYTVTDGTWVPGWRKVLPELRAGARARLVYLAAQVVVNQVARGAELVEHPHRPADHRVRPAHVDVPVGPGRLGGQFRHGAVHDVLRRLVRHRRDDPEPRIGHLHLAQVGEVIEVPPPPPAVIEHDLTPSAGNRRPDDRLDDRLDRGEPGPARQAQDVPGRGGVRGHRPGRSADHQRVGDLDVMDEGRADESAGYGPDMQAQRPVGPRRVGDRVPAPQPGPVRCLHADVLAWQVAQRLVGPQREHHEIGPAWLHGGYGPGPPRGGVRGVPSRALDHDASGVIEHGQPGLLRGRVPALGREPAQGGHPCLTEHVVVPLADPELPVRTPEVLQVGIQRRAVLGARCLACALDDASQRAEGMPALLVHGRGEHRPDLMVHGEQLPVEVRHRSVGPRFQHPE
jgi:thymidylate synthase ThyX